MKNLKKIVALLLCAVLLVAGSVAGTLAYLQSQSATVTNTFTVGELNITLDEVKTNEYGEAQGTTRVTGNTYKLVPGHLYTKDPTVHVAQGSEPCYVFVNVENGLADIEAAITIANQMLGKGWVNLGGNVWYYNGIVDARTAAQDVPVFESFRLTGEANVAAYGSATITVIAYAVQSDGFASAEAAWTATYGAPANP